MLAQLARLLACSISYSGLNTDDVTRESLVVLLVSEEVVATTD